MVLATGTPQVRFDLHIFVSCGVRLRALGEEIGSRWRMRYYGPREGEKEMQRHSIITPIFAVDTAYARPNNGHRSWKINSKDLGKGYSIVDIAVYTQFR